MTSIQARRTEHVKILTDSFTFTVTSYPDVRDIPEKSGRFLADSIRDMAALSKSPRWTVACTGWADFIDRQLDDQPDTTHYAFVQGLVDFLHHTQGLLDDPDRAAR